MVPTGAATAVHLLEIPVLLLIERILMKSQPESWNAKSSCSAQSDGDSSEQRAGSCEEKRQHSDEFTVRHIHSAGGVAYRLNQNSARESIQVALIATDRECRRWQLPKGRLYPSELPLSAALREVEEETGLETTFESFLKTLRYQYLDTYARSVPERVFKKVDFFLLRVVGGNLSDESVEVQKVEWASTDDALCRLAYDGEKDCIKLALEYLNGH